MEDKTRTQRTARIATAIVLAALVLGVAAPLGAADNQPAVTDDGVTYGPCAGADLGQTPPSYYVDVFSCVPPS